MRLKPTELSDKFTATTIGSSSAVILLLIARKFNLELSQTEAGAIVALAAAVCCYMREEKVFARKIEAEREGQ